MRVDLDPGPGVGWGDVQRVAMEVKRLLDEVGLQGWPKTSGSRGMHVNVRIDPRWGFGEVRRGALALSREIERRVPDLATSKWWKEERHGVFLDYNQNAKDRTTASAYSVRPLPDARVSAPLRWEEVETCDPAAFTVFTMPERFAQMGDPHEGMNEAAGSLEGLLEMAARDETQGLGDAPWPPHFAKQEGEPARVMPSKARTADKSFAHQLEEGFGARRFKGRSRKIEKAGQGGGDGSSPAAAGAEAGGDPVKAPRKGRTPRFPLVTVAESADKSAAEAGLARWKERHAEAAAHLAVEDVLVDRMRGSAYVWYRIRVNLRNVPEQLRPGQETPDPDEAPDAGAARARKVTGDSKG
jgi:hypothetical protein